MKFGISNFMVQWHITTACPNRCRHCYMYDWRTYPSERDNELADGELIQALDSICEFERKWGASINGFAITGGDPLARPGWLSFLRTLTERGKTVSLMGIPDTLTDSNLASLAKLGLAGFQLSLDGLESTHDYIRGRGSFQRTLAALDRLDRYGIPSQIMFTLHETNREELIPLLNLVATRTSARAFCFDIMCATGNGALMPGTLSRTRFLSLCDSYLEEKARLGNAGYPIRIHEKPSLFKMLQLHRQGRPLPGAEEVPVFSGCPLGWTAVSILADGSVLPCRRLPVPAGKLPEQTFEEILLGSETLRRFRRADSFAGCGPCPYYGFCRGCPAMVHGLTGDPFAQNPLCFLDHLPGAACVSAGPKARLPELSATHEEEYELIGRHFVNVFRNNFKEIIGDEGVASAILACQDPEARRIFDASPDEFCSSHSIRLSDLQRCFVQAFEQQLDQEVKARVRQVLFRRMYG